MKPYPKKHLLEVKPYVAGKREANTAAPVKLSSNENPYGASPKALEAYKAASQQLHRYGDSHCTALREAIGKAQALPAEHIVVGAGSDEIISLLINAYAGQGDEVLFTKHAFSMYRIYSQVAGASFVEADETELTTDVDKLLACVSDRTKVVFLANPNNPTGTYIPPSEVKRLRDGLREDIILALDGAYSELVDAEDYTDGRELVAVGENTIIMHTFSKVYGLPALRLGWAYGPPAIIDILNRARSPFNVNSAAQAAGVAAIEDTAFLASSVQQNKIQRDRLQAELPKLGFAVVPSQGNFVLMHCGTKAAELNAFLLERNIIIREMGGYYLPDYLRISIGNEQENGLLLMALAEFVKVSDVANAV